MPSSGGLNPSLCRTRWSENLMTEYQDTQGSAHAHFLRTPGPVYHTASPASYFLISPLSLSLNHFLLFFFFFCPTLSHWHKCTGALNEDLQFSIFILSNGWRAQIFLVPIVGEDIHLGFPQNDFNVREKYLKTEEFEYWNKTKKKTKTVKGLTKLSSRTAILQESNKPPFIHWEPCSTFQSILLGWAKGFLVYFLLVYLHFSTNLHLYPYSSALAFLLSFQF